MIVAFSCEKDSQMILAAHEQHSALCLTTDCVTEGNVNVRSKSGQLDARVVQFSSFFKDSIRSFLAPRLETMSGSVLPAWRLMEVDELAEGELLQIYVPMITEQSTHLEGLLAITANRNTDLYSFNFFSRDRLIDLPPLAIRDLTAYGPTAQYDRGAALALFDGFNSTQFGVVDADLHAQLNYKEAIPLKDDCVVKNYLVTSCFSVYGGANRERYLYTDCKTSIEYGVGVGDCSIGSRGGPGGGSGGGGSSGGLGNSNGSPGSTIHVNNRDRCAEDGVGCEEEDEEEKPRKERAPETIVLDVDCKTHPCLCQSINQVTLMNGVGRIGNMLHNVFGADAKVNVVISTSDKTSEPIDPATWATTTSQGSPDGTYFTAYITFNVDKFQFCSRAAFVATLLHESVHAYIDSRRSALSDKEFEQKFPLWSNGSNNAAQHEIFASEYVSIIAGDLRRIFPSMPQRTAILLAWGGLSSTNYWKTLTPAFRNEVAQMEQLSTCQIGTRSDRINANLSSCY